ncbi:MAG TPA: M48 family metallopeptidase, partial [Phycisphaerae bacterium]|nr:M48 family metallopeptidase [Phycisphaerae bacterium]
MFGILATAWFAGCSGSAGNWIGPGRFGFFPVQPADACLEIEQGYGGVWADEAETRRLNQLIDRIARFVPELEVRCCGVLLQSEAPAALSLSDGHIYLTRGLYRRLSEHQLVSVVAHEIGHVAARDGMNPTPAPAAQLAKEVEADRRAMDYLTRAGLPGHGLTEALQLLADDQPSG